MIYRFYSEMKNDIPYDDSYDTMPDEDFSESYEAGVQYAEALEKNASQSASPRRKYTAKPASRAQSREKMKKAAEAANAFASTGTDTDVLGSYTGIPNALNGDNKKIREIPDNGIDRKIADGKIYMNLKGQRERYTDTKTLSPYEYHSDVNDYEVPVQDADDL